MPEAHGFVETCDTIETPHLLRPVSPTTSWRSCALVPSSFGRR